MYILSMTLEYTTMRYTFDRELQLIRYVAYGLFLIKILAENLYEKSKLLPFVLLLLLSCIQAYGNGLREICFLLLILLACGHAEEEDALRLQIIIQLICLIGVFTLCIWGIVENKEFYDHGTIRYTMGFVYINGAGSLLFSSEIAWLYLRREKISIGEVVLFLTGWAVIYSYTDLRTMTLLGCTAVVICYLSGFCKWSVQQTPFKWLYMIFPAFMTAFSWILQCFYNGHSQETLMKILNTKLNGRLQLAKSALENYGLSLFGKRIQWIGNADNIVRNKYNYVDCAYIRIPLDFGIVIGLLFVAVYCYIMYKLVRENNRSGCLVLCIVMVCGFMMSVLSGISYNPLLLLTGGIFHGKPKVHQT